jgi:hypothetical protein
MGILYDFGPFDVRVGALQRSKDFADLIVRARPGTTQLQLYGATSIENAYGTWASSGITSPVGPQTAGSAVSGAMWQSPTVQKRQWTVDENRRGLTTFQLALSDEGGYDDVFTFLRIQEYRAGGWLTVASGANAGNPILGPTYMLAPMSYYGTASQTMMFQSSAPQATGCTAGAIPVFDTTFTNPPPLHIVFPRPAATVTIKNLSASDSLLVSFGLGAPMYTVQKGEVSTPTGGGIAPPGVREIIVASISGAGAAVPFAVEAVIGQQQM